MQPIQVENPNAEELAELDRLYRTTKSSRMRSRAQMILLSAERDLVPHDIGAIVRCDEQTVRRWLKRYQAEGISGLEDAPRPGAAAKVTPAYRQKLLEMVRLRPRSLNLPYSLWSLQRLADVMAEETGIRVSDETVRRILKEGGVVLARPQHTITSPDPEYQVKKSDRSEARAAKRG